MAKMEPDAFQSPLPPQVVLPPPSPAPPSADHKLFAASVGAVLTGLTMTPFDVIKTRLQTQNAPEPLFMPSTRLPPAKSVPSPQPSHIFKTSPVSSAKPSPTCCQPTFFNANSPSILCRFDPRLSRTTLSPPAYHQKVPVLPSSFAPSVPSSLNTLECEFPSKSVAKARLVESSDRLVGFWDALYKIVTREGPTSLWRGVGPTLLISVPSQVGYMIAYDKLRSDLLARGPISSSTGKVSSLYVSIATLLAGGFTRAAVVSFFSPVELFRTRVQSIPAAPHTSLVSILKSTLQVTREQGYRALWRGLPSTLWRDVPFSGIYWAGYEMVKRAIVGRGMGETSRAEDGRKKTFAVAFASGSVGALVAASSTHPFDVIKTRRQASSVSMRGVPSRTVNIFKEIIRKEGVKTLFSGLTPRLGKVVPACGIMIGVYEFAQ